LELGIGVLEKRKQFLFFGILAVVIGLVAFSPAIYALVEPHIIINMDPGQTTKPFQIKDNLGTVVFSVDTDGTIFPSDGSGAGSLVFAKVVKSVDEVVNNSNTFQNGGGKKSRKNNSSIRS